MSNLAKQRPSPSILMHLMASSIVAYDTKHTSEQIPSLALSPFVNDKSVISPAGMAPSRLTCKGAVPERRMSSYIPIDWVRVHVGRPHILWAFSLQAVMVIEPDVEAFPASPYDKNCELAIRVMDLPLAGH